MADFLSKIERSARMAAIKSKDTSPELTLRRILHRLGLRFRLHKSGLPGKPDLVFPRYKTVVFVHGCFWHRHDNCRVASTPKSNSGFWLEKFERNKARDARVQTQLRELGWRVLVVWECELSTKSRAEDAAFRLSRVIREEEGTL